MDKKNPSLEKGFTLIEILVAIAIVGILAGVVLVSMSSYRAKANASKITASLSSAATSMASCWGMGGFVLEPYADRNICTFTTSSSSISSYGKWPDIASLAANYTYSESAANLGSLPFGFIENIEENTIAEKPTLLSSISIVNTAHALGGIRGLPKADWYFSAQNATDGVKICCNQKMSGCKEIGNTTCDNNIN